MGNPRAIQMIQILGPGPEESEKPQGDLGAWN